MVTLGEKQLFYSYIVEKAMEWCAFSNNSRERMNFMNRKSLLNMFPIASILCNYFHAGQNFIHHEEPCAV